MRPDTPYDPAVKSVEEFSDVSAFEIFAPSPHQWVQLVDQLLRLQRHTAFCALTYLIHESADGLLARISIKPTRSCFTSDFALRQLKLASSFYLVTKKLKPM